MDGAEAARSPNNVSPLLKIPGYWSKAARARSHTLWTEEQLGIEPIKSRIQASSAWLKQVLGDKDLLIVGFWTDWSYLNAVLGRSLGTASASRVFVFDISDTAQLETKAPEICALSNAIPFEHVCISGAQALEELHVRFSQSIIKYLFGPRRQNTKLSGASALSMCRWSLPYLRQNSFWKTRRDLLGTKPSQPMLSTSTAGVGVSTGLMVLLLRAAGATFDNSY